jgi:hypothetical protein
MKNKKFILLLILSVAAIWGVIFYRIFAGDSDVTSLPAAAALSKRSFSDSYQIPADDTFKLSLNYRDPFLGGGEASETEEEITVISGNSLLPITLVKPPANWNAIKYNGYIVNPSSKQVVSIITVNGREQMVSVGASVDGVKLLGNYKDSIRVLYQDHIKYILLK